MKLFLKTFFDNNCSMIDLCTPFVIKVITTDDRFLIHASYPCTCCIFEATLANECAKTTFCNHLNLRTQHMFALYRFYKGLLELEASEEEWVSPQNY